MPRSGLTKPVVDTLPEYEIRDVDMPTPPLKVWKAIRPTNAAH
ncbi:MAG: hypothetical protein WA633_02835 [Stellaceae bacterium]